MYNIVKEPYVINLIYLENNECVKNINNHLLEQHK